MRKYINLIFSIIPFMNKLRLLSFLFMAIIIGSLTSCGKDDDAQPTAKSMLTAKEWQGNKYYIDGNDMSSFVDVDAISWKFNSDGKYVMDYDGDKEEGTWKLSSDNKQLILDEDSDDEFTMEVLKLTNTALDLEWEEEDFETGETYTVEVRFIRD